MANFYFNFGSSGYTDITMSWSMQFEMFGEIDPRVPTWNGEGGAQGLEKFSKAAKGYVAGMKKEDIELAGPRLWRNLRGEA